MTGKPNPVDDTAPVDAEAQPGGERPTTPPIPSVPRDDASGSQPLLPGVENPSLQALRRELNDDAAVDHFVTDFLDLLDERLVSLEQLLRQNRIEATVTALLTIETSGQMVGAADLAAAAANLRTAVSAADARHVPDLYGELLVASAQTQAMFPANDPGPAGQLSCDGFSLSSSQTPRVRSSSSVIPAGTSAGRTANSTSIRRASSVTASWPKVPAEPISWWVNDVARSRSSVES